ncbi:hypothetical protein D9M70_529250 [compost metagenome]
MGAQLGFNTCGLIQLDQPSIAVDLHRVLPIGDDQDLSGLRQGREQRGAQRCGTWILAQWEPAGMLGWHVDRP